MNNTVDDLSSYDHALPWYECGAVNVLERLMEILNIFYMKALVQ